jgi:hypothetical protein
MKDHTQANSLLDLINHVSLDQFLYQLVSMIVDASQDPQNWSWRDSDESCDGLGFGYNRLLNSRRELSWYGNLSVPGIGVIEYAACVNISRDGIGVTFNPESLPVGRCMLFDDLMTAHDRSDFWYECPREILGEAARRAVSSLSAPGLEYLVDQKCRSFVNVNTLPFEVVYDDITDSARASFT